MERWYLLITEKFFVRKFQWSEKPSFFQPKIWWKNDIYLVFLSFSWYFRTWEIRFFAQWFFLYKHIWIFLWWILCTFLLVLWTIKISVVSAISWISLGNFKWICSGLLSMVKTFPSVFTVVSDFIWLFFHYFYQYFC